MALTVETFESLLAKSNEWITISGDARTAADAIYNLAKKLEDKGINPHILLDALFDVVTVGKAAEGTSLTLLEHAAKAVLAEQAEAEQNYTEGFTVN